MLGRMGNLGGQAGTFKVARHWLLNDPWRRCGGGETVGGGLMGGEGWGWGSHINR